MELQQKNQKPLLQQIFEAKLKVTTLVTELESASESDLLLDKIT